MTEHRVTVHNPVGYPPKVEGSTLAQRLPSLDGKTVYLVDIGFTNVDVFMRELKDWFTEHRPAVNAKLARWRNRHEHDPDLAAEIREHGDAAILGVGL
jgi:hypothetical protein